MDIFVYIVYKYIYLQICLSFHLSVCPLIYLPACQYIPLTVYTRMSIEPSIYVSVTIFVGLPIYLSAPFYLSVCLTVYQSVCVSFSCLFSLIFSLIFNYHISLSKVEGWVEDSEGKMATSQRIPQA